MMGDRATELALLAREIEDCRRCPRLVQWREQVAREWRAGFANQPTSTHRADGLRLRDAWVAAAVRCAPPANRPSPAERDACLPWSVAELRLLRKIRVGLCLGGFAWDAALRLRAAVAGPASASAAPAGASARAEHPGEPFSLLGAFTPVSRTRSRAG
jgi:uracil-DNA glycosylase